MLTVYWFLLFIGIRIGELQALAWKILTLTKNGFIFTGRFIIEIEKLGIH